MHGQSMNSKKKSYARIKMVLKWQKERKKQKHVKNWKKHKKEIKTHSTRVVDVLTQKGVTTFWLYL